MPSWRERQEALGKLPRFDFRGLASLQRMLAWLFALFLATATHYSNTMRFSVEEQVTAPYPQWPPEGALPGRFSSQLPS